MKTLLLSLMVGLISVSTVFAQVGKRPERAGDLARGDYLILVSDQEPPDQPAGPKKETVEVGGLVMVVIPDTMSQPTTKFKVEHGRMFRHLGTVSGAQDWSGEIMFGGGRTVYLLKALNSTKATVKLSYTPNGGGDEIKKEYNFEIVEPEKGDGQ